MDIHLEPSVPSTSLRVNQSIALLVMAYPAEE